ncbi:glycine betaine ABC transporter substrate-binding protein [Nocardia sp. BSTN01]|uniref:glycine betaine ABC transporter substrate-binding protein n=1 Tax=Nocardia sp. BSTN01 TaxID=2783665 RepID=UPI00188EB552|nr:glycine betaine ABC transporter substrate-binding protein [Nocardia sp. BSTN01]MBF5001213.1 glycine betaine ABC transporter substrate-binding protein [Nocardia sp. BSTN01]
MKRRASGAARRAATAAATLLVAVAAACGLEAGGAVPLPVGPGSIEPIPALDGVQITVGSKDFTEQNILGYLIEFALTAAGAQVRDLTNITGSNSLRDAQLHGQVDIAYDYTGTGWINYLGNETPIPDSTRQFEAVRDADLAQHGMVWADPAPMNNTYTMVTGAGSAARTGAKTISDYARLVNTDPSTGPTCLGTEFSVRQDGFPGLARKYGIDLGKVHKQIMQDSLVYSAVANGTCQFGDVTATDGRTKALNLVQLIDDLNFFPKYNAALVMRKSFADAHPQVAQVMAPISALLTNETITELNRKVDVDGAEPATVAREWLIRQGFVTAG